MKNLSIKEKLYSMILVIFIPIIITELIGINNLFKKNVEFELRSSQDFAEAVSVSFANYIERIWDTELSMGMAVSDNPSATSDEIAQYMKSILENQPTVKEYAWVDPSTLRITASTSKEAIGVTLNGREYIDEILSGQNEAVSDMVVSRVFHEPTFIVVRAIKKDNILKGIIIANINIGKLGQVLPPSRAAEYSFFGLIDKQGVIMFRNEAPDIVKKMINVKDDPYLIPALRGEIVKIEKYLSPITGKNMIGVNLPVQKTGWVAYANSSYDEVLSRTYRDMQGQLIIIVLIIIAGLFLSIRICKQILNPIAVLKASAKQMSEGNLNVRTRITGTDEIALAAQAFDNMAASLEQYDILKTQFFSNISHELKTPLNIILTSIQMIEIKHHAPYNYESIACATKYMSMMRQNCYRLLRLINNLIDITRIDSGFFKLNLGNYNLISVVEDITLSVADFSESKGISLIFDTEVEEKLIACDPDKIERIMLNLLSNSIKFTPSGGSIFVNIMDKGDRICITVRDTGIGIPADKLSIIFERFRQVDSSLQREYEGSGIGLSLVKALVEAHEGSIQVGSEYGQGTEVMIELPVLLIPEENSSAKNSFDKQSFDKVQKINIEFSDIYS